MGARCGVQKAARPEYSRLWSVDVAHDPSDIRWE
jgi:hypothetical protein